MYHSISSSHIVLKVFSVQRLSCVVIGAASAGLPTTYVLKGLMGVARRGCARLAGACATASWLVSSSVWKTHRHLFVTSPSLVHIHFVSTVLTNPQQSMHWMPL